MKRTELARGAVRLTRATGLARRRPQRPATAPKAEGWPQDTREAATARSGGVCEVAIPGVCLGRAMNHHHRLPRRMGGTRRAVVNSLCNVLHLCGTGTTGCHGHIETNRAEALENGWLLHANADPASEPAVVRGRLVWLTEAGKYVGPTEGIAL